MKRVRMVIFAAFAISCFGLTASRGTGRHQTSDAPDLQDNGTATVDRSDSAKRSEHLDKLIRQQQRRIENLRNRLLAEERTLDKLLIQSGSLDNAHKPAIVLNHTSATGIVRNEANGFRKGDRLVFVRRTAQGITFVGQGTIMDTEPSDAYFSSMGSMAEIHPEDEVYISNRGDSVYSLALLRF